LVLGIVNASHLVNHTNSSIGAVLYPVMMGPLGFGFFEIGVLQTLYQISAQGCQVLAGLIVQYVPRSIALGIGNIFLGLTTILTGMSQNFFQVTASRVAGGAGASVQHPVGSSILVGYFPEARGRVLTLHHSAGNLGGLVAPAVAGGLLLVMDWRAVFYILAFASIAMGICYFFFRDAVGLPSGSKKQRAKTSMQEYLACLRNRNVMLVSLIQMVGAAGRGTGISVAFMTGFFIVALGADVTTAAILLMIYQAGGLLGPLAIGWLSDRFNRKWVLQLSLLASTLTTLWLLVHHGVTPLLILNLIIYGSVIYSRSSLTQAMVSDSVPLHQTDTAFSLYFFIGFISGPIWTLVMGWLIDWQSFSTAFVVVSISYLLGMLFVVFAENRPTTAGPAPSSAGAAGA
jgi:FSR family fosmidomycin resistance protein-like MFS transporter